MSNLLSARFVCFLVVYKQLRSTSALLQRHNMWNSCVSACLATCLRVDRPLPPVSCRCLSVQIMGNGRSWGELCCHWGANGRQWIELAILPWDSPPRACDPAENHNATQYLLNHGGASVPSWPWVYAYHATVFWRGRLSAALEPFSLSVSESSHCNETSRWKLDTSIAPGDRNF